jgi:hypothetical protein
VQTVQKESVRMASVQSASEPKALVQMELVQTAWVWRASV